MKEDIKEILKNLSEDELQIVREYIVEKFKNIITEMAFDRKTVIKKIDGLEKPINLHLIKIIRYKDDLNFSKHLKDIIQWLRDIQELDVGKKDKKLPEKEYFKLLFSNRFTDKTNSNHIKDLEKGSLSDYKDLEKMRTEEETIILLFEIHKIISKKLADNDIWDIEDIIINKLKEI